MNTVRSVLVVSLFVSLPCQVMAAAAGRGSPSRAAQLASSTTGAITGTITDASGAVLPGVAVTVSGATLVGTQVASTNSEGQYRFAGLPPGEYSLAFVRQGLKQTARRGIYISVGFTATVDVQLVLETLQQNVTVVGEASVIDRQSTAVGATFTARQLSDLPTSRSMFGILSATPAVHVARVEVGGSSGDAGNPYEAYGTAASNRPMVEGISVSGISPTGFTLDFGSFNEVSVGTAGHGPDWPLPGVRMQFIAKSGGNQYHGSVYGDYEHRALQSFNIDDDQIQRAAGDGGGLPSREANRLWSYHDVNADIGGYIARDKAWWYFSAREQDVAARVVNFPVKPLRTRLVNYSGKITYQLTPNNKFVWYAQSGRNYKPIRLDPFGPPGGGLTAVTAINESEQSTTRQHGRGWIWKGEWSSVIGSNTFIELRLGEFGADRPEEPNGTALRFEDVASLIVRGGNRDWQQSLRRDQVLGSFTYFRSGWFGTHTFKAGGEIFRTMAAEIWKQSYPGDVLHVLRNGKAVEVYLFETPSRSVNGSWSYGGYATDSWRVNRRLTLNLGLRLDRYRVFLPEQAHPVGRFNPQPQTFAGVANLIDWNVVVPRVGAVHDLTRSGKSMIKFSYAHYAVAPGTEVGFNANPNASVWWRRYGWTDANANGVWNSGEEGQPLDSRGGSAIESIDPGLKLPLLKEIGAWIERELPAGFGVRTGLVWRGERRHFLRQNVHRPFDAFSLPVSIPDPGPDGRLATEDDGPPIVGYHLGSELLDTRAVNVVRNVPGADSDFWTWDVAAVKRLSHRWSLVAGFDYLWNRDQTNAFFGQSVRQNPYPLTPNDLLHAEPNGSYQFRTWSAKIHGTYEAPWDVRVTPYLRHQSGQPFGRTFTATLNYGNVRILAEPIDTRRMDDITLIDLRIEKGFRLSAARRFATFVDVFNLLNANPEQNTSWASGTFLRPLNVVPPRIARVGMKFDW